MSAFDMASCFAVLIAIAGWINVRWLRLPTASAMLAAGLLSGAVLLVIQSHALSVEAFGGLLRALRALDFPKAVLDYMLAFLLFAGATHVDLGELRRNVLVVGTLATIGVATCTLLVGAGIWLGSKALGLGLGLRWAFVFGALISATDPIAVLAAVKDGDLSRRLQAVLQGEALLNDGVGIVVFTAAVGFATEGPSLTPAMILWQVAVESVGGMAIGAIASLIAIRAVRLVDDFSTEVVITLALAMGVYSIAQALQVSGPLAVVAAGLLVGDRGLTQAMSDTSRRYVRGFWTVIDEILNALLFLLLGLQLLLIPLDLARAGLWLIAVILVIAARGLVVFPWGLRFSRTDGRSGAAAVLTWGGLHGALSLALALTLPAGEPKALLLPTTFAVVVFSILIQGSTFAMAAKHFGGRKAAARP